MWPKDKLRTSKSFLGISINKRSDSEYSPLTLSRAYLHHSNVAFAKLKMALIRVSDPVFLPESGSSFQISLDPDPVLAPGSQSLQTLFIRRKLIMTKDRKKMKKAVIMFLQILLSS